MCCPAKKVVQFAPADKLEEVHEISISQEHEKLYLSCLEFEAIKQTCRLEGCQARKEGLDRQLECTFTDASDDVQKRLHHYTRHYDCRGLERMISKAHYDERRHHRELAVKAVLIGQKMAKEQGMNPDDVSEQLRKVALVYCLDAKIFARRLGKADEVASESQNKKGSPLLNKYSNMKQKIKNDHSLERQPYPNILSIICK
jgi:hypothetical protein